VRGQLYIVRRLHLGSSMAFFCVSISHHRTATFQQQLHHFPWCVGVRVLIVLFVVLSLPNVGRPRSASLSPSHLAKLNFATSSRSNDNHGTASLNTSFSS
jgi:hypothetical protein